ncbi:unnamed protein product [Oppiella nova]|uniref:Sorbitol dehydrogenase n=1 Tax=Oppiella nova TaxID=334625 RepID=A0A7R9M5L0_9ACAR|nr:unnamed protein product [Oppiella nova]CAG2170924.1 unnamed protein product [Oppiella nova]
MLDNLSLVLHKKDDLRLEVTELPGDPAPNVGICGSDIHFWKDGGIDKWVVKNPIVLGHEGSATVIKVGAKVKNFKVGDRVAVEPGIACLNCQVCKDGNYNLCPDVMFYGVEPLGGALRRYYNQSAAFCHKLADNMTMAEGALMEPLAVAVYACRRGGIRMGGGQKVMVTGAGPIGLLAALSAKALGAEVVCILDINESRLQFAKQLGIDKTVLIDTKADVESLCQQVVDLLGDSPDVSLECSGAEMSYNLAISASKCGANIVMIGVSNKKVSVNLSSAACRQVNLLGVMRYLNSFPMAIHLVSSGKINIKPLITHTYKLEEALEAFETSRNCAANGAIKVHIQCYQ